MLTGTMGGMQTSPYDDRARLTDALASQKFVTECYNTWCNECSNASVRSELMNILNEEHQLQYEIFEEMRKRGWYQVQPAEPQKIHEAKTRFTMPQ